MKTRMTEMMERLEHNHHEGTLEVGQRNKSSCGDGNIQQAASDKNDNHNNNIRNGQQPHYKKHKMSREGDFRRNHRIVLLLDLDCFYAQCECLRLGYDASITALALLQWNSVLAVTYPARTQFGVKRGDSWSAIREKVGAVVRNQPTVAASTFNNNNFCCHAIHVPLLTTEQIQASATSSSGSPAFSFANHQQPPTESSAPNTEVLAQSPSQQEPQHAILSLEEEYKSIYQLSRKEQEDCRRRELGVRRLSHEGKASIERYRIASARIFQVVHELIHSTNVTESRTTTQKSKGRKSPRILLERASIDEFYLDVTQVVQRHNQDENKDPCCCSLWNDALVQEAKLQTKQVGNDENNSHQHKTSDENIYNDDYDDNDEEEEMDAAVRTCMIDDDDDEDDLLLWRGAAIALAIRKHVYATLGFTLTAGIGTNKTLAKLTASYGKPNGQAVTVSKQIPFLLQRTPLHKCRNLGGKLGQQVIQELSKAVPSSSSSSTKEFTVASIAQHLSVPGLRRAFGSSETAQWLFELSAYGIDKELVVPKQQSSHATQDDLFSSSTSSSSTKSLTAFKSLPNSRSGTGHSIAQASAWIHLLATDLVTRVQRDAQRNGRFPKTCTLHYTKLLASRRHNAPPALQKQQAKPTTQTKSVRVQFPVQLQQQQTASSKMDVATAAVQSICVMTANTLRQTEGIGVQLTRLGFTATDFVRHHNHSNAGSIDRYFCAAAVGGVNRGEGDTNSSMNYTTRIRNQSSQQKRPRVEEAEEEKDYTDDDPVLVLSQAHQERSESPFSRSVVPDQSQPQGPVTTVVPPVHPLLHSNNDNNVDKDLALAKKLQAQYDREDRAWNRHRFKKKPRRRQTIDSFFSSAPKK